MAAPTSTYSVDFAAAKTGSYIAVTDEKYGTGPGYGRFDGSQYLIVKGLDGPNAGDVKPSLAASGERPAIGQIVVWEVMVTAGKEAKADGSVTMTLRFGLDTTSGADYGFDFRDGKGLLSAFVDSADKTLVDPNKNATVSAVSEMRKVVGEKSSDWMEVDITVSGLSAGDKVPVEIWTVLRDDNADKFTGVVQSSLVSAKDSSGAAIAVGTQTIPLKLKGAPEGGAITGNAWLDADNGGTVSAGDTRQAGVVIFLDRDKDGVLDADETYTKTDATGSYTFTGLEKGDYVVNELVPEGTKRLTALQVVTIKQTDDVILGIDFLNRTVATAGSIAGTVYADSDSSGGISAADKPAAGVKIYLDLNNSGGLDAGDASTVTDGEGRYNFTNLGAGTYTVREVVPEGFTQALGPKPITIDAKGGAITGANLLNSAIIVAAPNATILGTAWLDEDRNGAIGAKDSALPGLLVYIDRDQSGTLTSGDIKAETDGKGLFSFAGLDTGTYTIRALTPDGLEEVLRPSVITIASKNQVVSGADFLERKLAIPGSISGTVWTDLDNTKDLSGGDKVAAGVTVYLDRNNSGTLDAGDLSTVTGSDGRYGFTGLAAATYTLREVVPAGATLLKMPEPISISIAGGEFGGRDFLNAPVPVAQPNATILGSLWLDADRSDSRSETDPPLSGVIIYIDRDKSGTFSAGDLATKTDEKGNYSFTGLDTGTYVVREVVPEGLKQISIPAPVVITAKDQVVAGVDFLDQKLVQPGSISGRLWVDTDASGSISDADKIISGATIYLDMNYNGVRDEEDVTGFTNADGKYGFSGLAPGVYVVREVIPYGHDERIAPEKLEIGTEGGDFTGRDFLVAALEVEPDKGVILGTRWLDADASNGISEKDEGLAGRLVYLDLDRSGSLTEGDIKTETDEKGNYAFEGLGIGSYDIRGDLPDGLKALVRPKTLQITSKTDVVKGADFLDQKFDAGAAGLLLGRVTLALPPGVCADQVAALPGMTVTLRNQDGVAIGTTETDAEGRYAFDHLAAGDYSLHFTAPDDMMIAGGTDADGTITGITLKEAGVQLDLDAMLRHRTGSLLDGESLHRTDPNAYDVTKPDYVSFEGAGQVNINATGAYVVGGEGGLTASSNAAGQYLVGGNGSNLLNGGSNGAGLGGSMLVGGNGSNTLIGTSGNDIIIGGCGLNLMQGLGSVGIDGPRGLAGFDFMVGGESPDRIEGNTSIALLQGGAGNDEIHGNGTIIGGTNDGGISWDGAAFQKVSIGDRLDGGGNAATVFVYQQGDGVQWIQNYSPAKGDRLEIYGYDQPAVIGTWNGYTVWYFGENAALLFNSKGPADNVTFFGAQAAMSGGLGHFSPLPPTELTDQVTSFTGTSADDLAIGSAKATMFRANGGHDVLIGGAGDDAFFGGPGGTSMYGNGGHDVFYGGSGDDAFHVESQDELTFEGEGGGIDSTISTASVFLWKNVENLQLLGGTDLTGIGNDLGNVLIGNAGNNALFGYGGDDTISGGAGNDVIFGVDGNDVLRGDLGIDYIAAGEGDDTVDGGSSGDAIYGEAGNDSLSGGADFATDFIVGGDGNDTLDGASGNGDFDFLYGGAGDDTFHVDTPADLVFEAADGGNDTVIVTINGGGYYLYDNIENMVVGGVTPFGVGNAGANALTGGAGTQWLLGGGGNDTIEGGADFDVLFGEAGADLFIFAAGCGGDLIGDFTPGEDRILLKGISFVDFDLLKTAMVENSGTTAINLGGGDFIVLNGVANAALTAGDFLFA